MNASHRLGIQSRLLTVVAESGLTATAWAREHGLPRKTVAQWLEGSRAPNAEGLLRLREAGIDPEWLLTGDEAIRLTAPQIHVLRYVAASLRDARDEAAVCIELLTEVTHG